MNPDSLVENDIKNQDIGLGVFITLGVSFLLDPLSKKSQNIIIS